MCLGLQDEARADVNILLLCLWLAAAGKPALSAATLIQIDREAASWRESVIHPLRQARRGLGDFALFDTAALKAKLQAAELDAEHRAQLQLEACAARLVAGPSAGRPAAEVALVSLGNYLKMIVPGRAEAFAETVGLLARQAG